MNPDKACASCAAKRGNVRRGWEPITKAGAVIGWTCPACPRVDEPIRRRVIKSGAVNFRVTLDVTPNGATKRQQLTRVVSTLDDARALVAEVRQGVQHASARHSGPYVDPSRFTVRQVCESWLERRSSEVDTPGGIRANTANGYRSALFSLLRVMGHQTAREVTTDDVEAALRKLATDGGRGGRPLAHRSVVYALGALRQAFAYGVRQGWLRVNVTVGAKAPRKHGQDGASRRAKRWNTAQLMAFRAHLDGLSDGAALDAEPWLIVGYRLALCGLRRSEVMGLDWANVDRDAGTVTVTASRVKTGRGSATALGETKTENSRRIVHAETIHPGTAKALRALWLRQGRPASGLVIVDAVGAPLHPDTYSRRFRSLCSAAGVPDPGSIHNTRHTLASALKEAGVPDNQGAALLGHDAQTYLRFYVLADGDAAAEAAQCRRRLNTDPGSSGESEPPA